MSRSSSEGFDPEDFSVLDRSLSHEQTDAPLEPLLALSRSQETLRDYEDTLKELQQKLNDKESDLKEARDLIFRLQPSHQHITQSEAQKDYNALCESVVSWVNYHLGAIFDDDTAARKDFNLKCGEHLYHRMTPSSTASRGVIESDEWHIISAVMNFLLHEVLRRDFYGAAQEGTIEFLDSLVRSMNCLEPRRETSTCRAWRSEALVALANSPDFDKRREMRSHELAQKLAFTLRALLPGATKQELERKEESLYKSIIKPAVKVAERIQMSPEKFTLEFSQFAYALERDEEGNPPGIMEGIVNLDCLNLLQGGKAINPSVLQDPNARHNTVYLLDIFPGLSCQNFNGDIPSEVRILKKPKVLVAMLRPGKEDSDRIEEGSTLMDFIYNQVHTKRYWPRASRHGR